MVTLSLIGAGTIGAVHAANIAAHPHARLGWVYDVRAEAAAALAERHGAAIARSLDEALGDDVSAAIIASATVSHGAVAEACVGSGKAFLCEKPLARDLNDARRLVRAVRDAGITAAIGFNRRLDRGYAALRGAVAGGAIGRLEALLITSRSATPPTVQSVQATGGLLGEKGSHFFDLACWIAGEYPVELHAMGAALVDPGFAAVGEVDTAMITLAMPSGTLCQLDFSWRAAYGQDERLEAVGARGMLQTPQAPDAPFTRFDAAGLTQAAPLPGWLARFAPTYAEELDRFVRALEAGRAPELATLEDGLAAQRLAEAAGRSIREGRRIRLEA
jgi:myo-inositol 2-dehydrogenase / D-chiro-inositol 1-dehydrogenase